MKPVRILHLFSSFDLGGKEARAVQTDEPFRRSRRAHVCCPPYPMHWARAMRSIARVSRWNFPAMPLPPLYGKPGMGRYRKLASKYMKKFHLVLSYNWGSMDGVMARTLLGRFDGVAAADPP
jgi:hypothetical protein